MQVRACNSYCGAWSASSSTFTPYGPPGAPSISSSANDREVTFSWSSPANSNGARVTESRYRLNGGSWQSVSSRNSSISETGSWEQNHRIEVQVRNEHGQWSSSASRNQRAEEEPPPPPTPRAWIEQSAGTRTCQTNPDYDLCREFRLHWEDWPSGTYGVSFSVTGGDHACADYSRPRPGGNSYSMSMGGSGSAIIRHSPQNAPHLDGECGGTARITSISGAPSNAELQERPWR